MATCRQTNQAKGLQKQANQQREATAPDLPKEKGNSNMPTNREDNSKRKPTEKGNSNKPSGEGTAKGKPRGNSNSRT